MGRESEREKISDKSHLNAWAEENFRGEFSKRGGDIGREIFEFLSMSRFSSSRNPVYLASHKKVLLAREKLGRYIRARLVNVNM